MTAIEPGHRLTERYRVEELLLDDDGVRSWRAVDEVLSRSVLVQSLPADDPRTEPLMTAARAAAMVADPRFLRVLDVGTHDGMGYLVREWMAGANLRTVLVADGALAPERAGALAREVAEALRSAHEQGLHHLALCPDSVILGGDGAVKVTGLATDAVINGTRTDDPARTDAAGVGRILYVSLTGRWPGGPEGGLRAAPTVDGHLPSPRQVRAGVPRMLDDVADRTLGDPPRHGAAPLATPAAVAAALSAALPGPNGRRLETADGATRPAPALVDVAPLARVNAADPFDTTVAPRTVPRPPPEPLRGRNQMRVLGVVTAMIVVVGAALLGLQLLLQSVDGSDDGGDDPAGAASASATEGGTPLAVTAASDYDPLGNGTESPRTVALAFDGDPATAWTTQDYYDPLEQQKPGVGLVLDAGEVSEVAGVRLALSTGGGDVEIRAAGPDATAIPEALEGWQAPVQATDADRDVELAFDEPVSTRYVLVWFTQLPQDGSSYREGIAEATLLAP